MIQSKLSQSTPKFNVLLWQIGTFLYTLSIFINDNRGMLSELGISPETESKIKIAGVVIYFLFTYFNFNQTIKPQIPKL
jgi:hypothetical protein